MKNFKNLLTFSRYLYFVFFVFISTNILAQPNLPSRNITVLPSQPIDFGTFYITGPGTIEVDYQGNINTTGGVISLNTDTATPAIFEVKLLQGRKITINYDFSVFINGSNGGDLELQIGPTDRGISGSEFPVDNALNFITTIRVGGKLIIPANAVPGVYIGSFPIFFSQE